MICAQPSPSVRFCAGLRWPGYCARCHLVLRCQAYRAINKSPSRANPANPLTDAPLSRATSPSFAFSMTRYVRTSISAPFKGSELVWRSIRVGDSPRYPWICCLILVKTSLLLTLSLSLSVFVSTTSVFEWPCLHTKDEILGLCYVSTMEQPRFAIRWNVFNVRISNRAR